MTIRSPSQAVLRGLKSTCPNCGEGALFQSYLKNFPSCQVCYEELQHHRADDLPPYLTIFLVGHIVVPMVLYAELNWGWEMVTHMIVWPSLATILALVLLKPIKGAVIGLQWANKMHGFGGQEDKPVSLDDLKV